MLRLAVLLVLAVAAVAVPATAHPESAAAQLDARVAAAWHQPDPVVPGEQWSGYLRLHDGVTVGNVSYQVCNVADGVCFSYPHPAADLGNGTYRFHTADYLTNLGQPVRWEAGWRVGVRWFLADADGSGNGTWVPPQQPVGAPIEESYLAFDIPGEAERGAPGPTMIVPLLAVAAALAWTRARRRA